MTTKKTENRLSDDLANEITRRAEKVREQQPDLTREAAFVKVMEEEPELYTQHEHVRALEEYLNTP